MTCRVENGVTYRQNYNAENRISSIAKINGLCSNPGAEILEVWAFAYDGDGTRVSTAHFTGLNPTPDSMSAYYMGGAYEVTGGAVRKYYAFAGQIIAMKDGAGLKYLLTDHLGSVVAVTGSNGTLTSQQRYLPFGGIRTDLPSPDYRITSTDFGYTSQRKLAEGMGGLMDYKARFYSPTLGRFIQPDSIIPSVANPQSWNRFSYVLNNPIRYIDPSGHKPCDERDGCGITGKPQARCSAGEGYFNGSFKCTAADLNKVSIKKRKAWLNEMLASVDPGLPAQFTNINGILDAFEHTDTGAPGTWASWGDAGILTSIQNGLASAIEEKYIPGFKPADQAWKTYTESFFLAPDSILTRQLWGAAEGLGTNYGRLLAGDHGQSKTPGEVIFVAIGNVYRDAVARYNPDAIKTDVVRDVTFWFLNPASTIPYTDIPPVQLVAEITLRIK